MTPKVEKSSREVGFFWNHLKQRRGKSKKSKKSNRFASRAGVARAYYARVRRKVLLFLLSLLFPRRCLCSVLKFSTYGLLFLLLACLLDVEN